MSRPAFVVYREDGRSAAQVLIDHVCQAPSGQIFTFEELAAALNEGSDRRHTVSHVRQAVSGGARRLLAVHRRRLHNVRRVGYRLAPAEQHVALANSDHRRADRQLKKGLATLMNTRVEELSGAMQQLHAGTLMLFQGLYTNQQGFHRRLSNIEDVLRRMGRGIEPPLDLGETG